MKKLTGTLAVLVLALVVPAVATATLAIHAAPHTVKAGKVVRLYGSAGSCHKGDKVTLASAAFKGGKVFTKVDTHGNYSVKTKIPKSKAISLPYRIVGRCGGKLFAQGTLLVD